ncbi:MAG: hypothetical protein AAF975_06435 [Spirochaetota bacterium]
MKKFLGILIVIMPLSMMLNVYQSKRYIQAKVAIHNLQREQNLLLEENQRIIAEIARSGSPTVIEHLARSRSVGLSKIPPEQVLRIIIPEEDTSP